MNLTIDDALQRGVAAHKEGKIQDAERLYRAILQSQPAHPDANHNLGVLAVSVNKVGEAIPLFKAALESNPKIEQFWLSYINALIKDKKHDGAKQVLEQAKQQGVALEKLQVFEEQVSSKVQPSGSANPPKEQLDRLLDHYQRGRFVEAEELAASLTRDFPDHPFSWKVLGAILGQAGRNAEALVANQKTVELSPKDAEAHNNLAILLKDLGRLEEAEANLRHALNLKPTFAEAHYNLGITLQKLRKLDEAESSYRQAINLKPNYGKAHFNLGSLLKELGKLDEAAVSYSQAISIDSGYAEAHNNLGTTLKDLGQLAEAEVSYHRALTLQPDFLEAQYNLGSSLEEAGDLQRSLQTYNLMLKSKSEPVSSTKKSEVVALLPFGRSGSLFLHSLVDGHPEITTLPGVYLKAWFGTELWQKLAPDLSSPDWRERLVTIVMREFEPLFDANCKNSVIGEPLHNTDWLAKDLGFTSMGPDRSQTLSLNQDAFSQEFLNLLKPFSSLGISECFELIHQAFENSMHDKGDMDHSHNKTIFYHIHNPDPYEYLHFFKHYPEARFLQIIRNPVQSMESWMLTSSGKRIDHNLNEEDMSTLYIREWRQIVGKIITMFRQILSTLNNPEFNYGIRLEDIKRNPKEMMPKLASWMGVRNHEELYKSSFCGLQYWGPPSPTGNITGFDTKAIDTSIGRILGARDIIIFETLFWPLSKKYNYTDMDEPAFHLRLAEIRPWLDEPLEFEVRLYEQNDDHNSPIEALDPYIRLHQFMRLLWERLNRNEMYIGIPKPLMLT